MPKRKRGAENDPVYLRKEEVEQKLEHCRKLLNKALKLAKGFERQKLGRRVKTSTQKSDQDDLKRLHKEIEILKVSWLNWLYSTDMKADCYSRHLISHGQSMHTCTSPY